MRLLLTGDAFDAVEARRLGLVQEIAPTGEGRWRAMEIAERIAAAAPLAVRGVLDAAHVTRAEGAVASAERLRAYSLASISPSQDLRERLASLFERREPRFRGV